jgi:hypothetical protein
MLDEKISFCAWKYGNGIWPCQIVCSLVSMSKNWRPLLTRLSPQNLIQKEHNIHNIQTGVVKLLVKYRREQQEAGEEERDPGAFFRA